MNTATVPRVVVTIRIFGRCTTRADDRVWCVLEGPAEIATVLNAIADRRLQVFTFTRSGYVKRAVHVP
jgi:hypothetical protein